jgi:hypothetical protein
MKKVLLKKIPLVAPGGEKGELDYRVYIEGGIKQPLDGKAVWIDEMRKSVRLLNALEKAWNKDSVEFEDADFDYLCLKIKAMKFNWVDRAFEQFVDDVLGS